MGAFKVPPIRLSLAPRILFRRRSQDHGVENFPERKIHPHRGSTLGTQRHSGLVQAPCRLRRRGKTHHPSRHQCRRKTSL